MDPTGLKSGRPQVRAEIDGSGNVIIIIIDFLSKVCASYKFYGLVLA